MATIIGQGNPIVASRPVYMKQAATAGDVRVAIAARLQAAGSTAPNLDLDLTAAKYTGNDFYIDVQAYIQRYLAPRVGVKSLSFRDSSSAFYNAANDMFCTLAVLGASIFDVDSAGLINQRTTDGATPTATVVNSIPLPTGANVNEINNDISVLAKWLTDWDKQQVKASDLVNLTHYFATGTGVSFRIRRYEGATVAFTHTASAGQVTMNTLRAGISGLSAVHASLAPNAATTAYDFSITNGSADVYVEPFRLELVKACHERLHFLNRYGCADGINMEFIDPGADIERETYRQRQPVTESGHGNEPPMGGMQAVYSGELRRYETMEPLIFGTPLQKNFLQLLNTPELYLQVGSAYIPAVIRSQRYVIDRSSPQRGEVVIEILPNSAQGLRI